MTLSFSKATLLSLPIECIIYGVLTVLTAISWNILLSRRKKEGSLNKPLLIVSSIMYILATIHVVVNIIRVTKGFLDYSPKYKSPQEYFNSIADPLHVFSNAIYVLQTLVGDSFMVFRLYSVWEGDKRVVLPVFMSLVGTAVCGIGIIDAFAKAAHPSKGYFSDSINRWTLSFVSLTLSLNVMCTGLIAFRIWWQGHRTSKTTYMLNGRLSRIAIIVIESGLVYSISVSCFLVTYVRGSFGVTLVEQSLTQVIGVVFSTIILRISLGVSVENPLPASKSQMNSHWLTLRQLDRNLQPISVEMTHTRMTRTESTEVYHSPVVDTPFPSKDTKHIFLEEGK